MNPSKLAKEAPELFEQLMKRLRGETNVVKKVDDVTMIPKTNPMEVSPDKLLSNETPLPTFDPAVKEGIENVVTKKPMSTGKKAAIAAGATGAGVLGTGKLMDGEQDAKAMDPATLMALSSVAAPVVQSLVGGNDKPAGPSRVPSDEVSSAVQKAPVEAAPEKSDYVKELLAAQKSQNNLDFVDNMLMAGTTVGNALATPEKKADYTAVNALKAQNGQGVENVKQKMKTESEATELADAKTLRDPNSDVSKAFRQALAKLGIKHTDKTSASDAKAMGINIQNLLMHERTIAASSAKADKKEREGIDKYITGAQKTLLKPFQAYQKVATAKKALDGYLNGASSGPKDVAILYNFIKGLDPDSAVKEGEIELGKSAMSLMEQYGIQAKKLTNSDVLSPKFRAAIKDILAGQEQQAKESYEKVRQPFLLQGASLGLDEDDYGRLDYLSAQEAAGQKTQAPSSAGPKETVALSNPKSPGSIIRSGGKAFVVNADGKTATEQ